VNGARPPRSKGPAPAQRGRSALLVAAGAAGALAARSLLMRGLLLKFRREVRALNAGHCEPLLADYAQDAVLHFNEGAHRWAGDHRGKPAIARFLEDFVNAGIQGHISELFMAGAPWRMTLLARFKRPRSRPRGPGDLPQPYGPARAHPLGAHRSPGGLLRRHRGDRSARDPLVSARGAAVRVTKPAQLARSTRKVDGGRNRRHREQHESYRTEGRRPAAGYGRAAHHAGAVVGADFLVPSPESQQQEHQRRK
jgi:hypothetical protein